jgi:hypothetical protein
VSIPKLVLLGELAEFPIDQLGWAGAFSLGPSLSWSSYLEVDIIEIHISIPPCPPSFDRGLFCSCFMNYTLVRSLLH